MPELTIRKGLSGDWETVEKVMYRNEGEEIIANNGIPESNKTTIYFKYQPEFGNQPELQLSRSVTKEQNKTDEVPQKYISKRSVIETMIIPRSPAIKDATVMEKHGVPMVHSGSQETPRLVKMRSSRAPIKYDSKSRFINQDTQLYDEYKMKLKNASLRQRSLPPSHRQAEIISGRRHSHYREDSNGYANFSQRIPYYGNIFPPLSPYAGTTAFSPFATVCPHGQLGYNTMTPVPLSPFMMSPNPYMSAPMIPINAMMRPENFTPPQFPVFFDPSNNQQHSKLRNQRSHQQKLCVCCANGRHKNSEFPKKRAPLDSESDENTHSNRSPYTTSSYSPLRRNSNIRYDKRQSVNKEMRNVMTTIDRGQSPFSFFDVKWVPPTLDRIETRNGYPEDYVDLDKICIELDDKTPRYKKDESASKQVLEFVLEALFMASSLSDVAKNLKKEMDAFYGPTWHIVVGADTYGSNIAFGNDDIFHFKAFENTFLIWRT